MIKLRELLSEDLFGGGNKMKPYERFIAGSVIEFMKNKFNFTANITVRKKNNDSLLGDISLSDASVNRGKFVLHFNPNQSYTMMIQSIIHELTHVKQVSKKELLPAEDYKSIVWKGKEWITVRELKKLNISDYKKLPWEVEAYSNMKKLYRPFLQSKYWKKLKGKDATLDYIMDNL